MNLPPIIKDLLLEPVKEPVELDQKEEVKPIVIILARDLKKEDLALLTSYGKVIVYEGCFNNIELKNLDFLYFVLDLRKPDDRLYYSKHVVPIKEQVKEILYHHAFEELEFDVDVIRTKFPIKQATLQMFNQLLFQNQLPKPRACFSFLKKCVQFGKE